MQQMSFDFSVQASQPRMDEAQDYHRLPASPRQQALAQRIARDGRVALPADTLADRRALSAWIDRHKPVRAPSRFDAYPSSKQVAFAERIARLKRRTVPQACFKDKVLMSRWIDSNR